MSRNQKQQTEDAHVPAKPECNGAAGCEAVQQSGEVFVGANKVRARLERTQCRRCDRVWATTEQSARNKKRLTNALKRALPPRPFRSGDRDE